MKEGRQLSYTLSTDCGHGKGISVYTQCCGGYWRYFCNRGRKQGTCKVFQTQSKKAVSKENRFIFGGHKDRYAYLKKSEQYNMQLG